MLHQQLLPFWIRTGGGGRATQYISVRLPFGMGVPNESIQSTLPLLYSSPCPMEPATKSTVTELRHMRSEGLNGGHFLDNNGDVLYEYEHNKGSLVSRGELTIWKRVKPGAPFFQLLLSTFDRRSRGRCFGVHNPQKANKILSVSSSRSSRSTGWGMVASSNMRRNTLRLPWKARPSRCMGKGAPLLRTQSAVSIRVPNLDASR